MQKKAHEVERYIESKTGYHAVILIYGPDQGMVSDYTKTIEKAVLAGNPDPFALIQLDSDEIADNPSRLVDEATTIALFGGERFIRVRMNGRKQITKSVDALLKSDAPDTTVVFEAADLKKNNPLRTLIEKSDRAIALPCYHDDQRSLYRLVEERFTKANISADRDAIDSLISLLGEDRRTSLNEIEKLILYASETRQITQTDVETLVGDAATSLTEETIDNTLSGNVEQALSNFARSLSFGHNAFQTLSGFMRQLNQLQLMRVDYDMGKNAKQCVDGARPMVHFKRKTSVITQVGLWQSPHLAKAIDKTTNTIIETRQKPILADTLTKSLITQLASQARRQR